MRNEGFEKNKVLYTKKVWLYTKFINFSSAIHLKYIKKISIHSKIDNLPLQSVLHSKFMFLQWEDNYNYLHGVFILFSAQTKDSATRMPRLASTENTGKKTQLHHELCSPDSLTQGLSTVSDAHCCPSLKHTWLASWGTN